MRSRLHAYIVGILPEPLARLFVYRVLGLAPVVGGDGNGDGGGGGDSGGDAGGGDGGDQGGSAGGDAGASGQADQGGQGGDDGDEQVTVSRRELDNLNRRRREAETNAQRLEREKREQDEAKARDAGEFERLYTEERERREQLELRIETEQRERRGLETATRLRFREPAKAVRLLSNEELADDDATERALRQLATESPYLLADGDRTPQSGSVGGGNGGGGALDMNARIRQAAGRVG